MIVLARSHESQHSEQRESRKTTFQNRNVSSVLRGPLVPLGFRRRPATRPPAASPTAWRRCTHLSSEAMVEGPASRPVIQILSCPRRASSGDHDADSEISTGSDRAGRRERREQCPKLSTLYAYRWLRWTKIAAVAGSSGTGRLGGQVVLGDDQLGNDRRTASRFSRDTSSRRDPAGGPITPRETALPTTGERRDDGRLPPPSELASSSARDKRRSRSPPRKPYCQLRLVQRPKRSRHNFNDLHRIIEPSANSCCEGNSTLASIT